MASPSPDTEAADGIGRESTIKTFALASEAAVYNILMSGPTTDIYFTFFVLKRKCKKIVLLDAMVLQG